MEAGYPWLRVRPEVVGDVGDHRGVGGLGGTALDAVHSKAIELWLWGLASGGLP